MAEPTTFPEHLTNGPQRNGTNGLYYPSQTDTEEQEVSLHEILEVLFKNKWTILTCFVLVLAGAAFHTLRQDPEYEAKSTVYVKSQRSNAQLNELLGLETFNRNIANEIEIAKSRKIAMLVAEQLIDIEFVPGTDRILSMLGTRDDGSQEFKLKVAQRLQGHIRVQPVSRGVDIIELVATSTIPDEARLVSNLWAEEYVKNNQTTSRAHMKNTREFLSGVAEQYKGELEREELNLTSFFSRESLAAPDEEAKQLIGQVGQLQTQQYETHLGLGMEQAEPVLCEVRPCRTHAVAPGEEHRVLDQTLRSII